MRKLLGYLILILGVAGLGFWARGHQASRMEADITATAEGVASASVHGAETRVSGRDITISGLADSAEERDNLIAGLEAVPGRRVVNDDLRVIETASPYTFGLEKAEDGALSNAIGFVPTEVARGEVADLIGADAAAGLTLASGAPTEGWSGAIGTGLGALSRLQSGMLSLSDGSLKLEGMAATQADADAALTALQSLPAGYMAETSIEVPVEPMPGDWSLSWAEAEGGAVSGVLPAGLDKAALAAALGGAELSGDVTAQEASDPAEAQSGLAVLAALSPKLPEISGFTLNMAGLDARAEVSAKPGADVDAIEAALVGVLPQDAAINVTATLPEPDYAVTYSADQGASLSGAVPEGLDGPAVAQALGLSAVDAATTQASGGAEARQAGLDLLGKFRGWLPQIEKLGLQMGGAPKADVVLGAGSDAELVEGSLSESLGDAVALNVASATAGEVTEGAERVNAATGEAEQFFGGFWLPKRDFTPDVATCNSLAKDILDRFGIGFVTGSARLNAEAARAVNELAAVMRPCAESGLSVELGGHTDATGDAELNRELSQERAGAVYEALSRRGVPADAMTAQGYGPDLPIADNATEEGRAQNRRTTITWTN